MRSNRQGPGHHPQHQLGPAGNDKIDTDKEPDDPKARDGPRTPNREAEQLKLGLVVKIKWPREGYIATHEARKLEDDDYIPSVLETVSNDLELGEIVDVHEMRSWTDDADQIELATAYLADRLKRGRVVRIRWPREGYLATREVQWWVESGSVVRIGDELMALCDAESLLGI